MWNDLQMEAKAKGWLVFAMIQGETIYEKDPAYGVSTGYCCGMSCQWLSDMYWSRSFDVGPDQVVDLPPLKGVLVHRLARVHGHDWTMWDRALLEYSMYRDTGLGLEDAARHTPDTAEMAKKFLGLLEKSFGGYAWGCWGGGGAHGMAMFRSPGRLDLFDANNGHFRFETNTALEGLKWFLDGTSYKDSLDWETRICKVNEPYNYDTTTTQGNYSRPTDYKPYEFTLLPAERNVLARVEEIDVPLYIRPKKVATPGLVQSSTVRSSGIQTKSKHARKSKLVKRIKRWWNLQKTHIQTGFHH